MERLGCEEEGSTGCSLSEGSCIVSCGGVVSIGESYWLLEKDPGKGVLGLRFNCCVSDNCGK